MKNCSIAVPDAGQRAGQPEHRQAEDFYHPLAIRLVLDRAATTQEAVDLLLDGYDMFATSGRDYHFLCR